MNYPRHQFHEDAAVSAFYAEQLEAMSTRVLTTKVKPTRAAELMNVTDANIPEWAEAWSYLRTEEVAYSRWLADASNDMPWADLKVHKETFAVRRHGVGYYVTDVEAMQARAAGVDLSDRRAMAARKGAERKRDQILLLGDTSVGLTGLLNNAQVPTTTDTAWAGTSKTTAEMLADLGQWLETSRGYHKDTVRPNTLVLPPAAYNHARVTKETGSDLTTLEFLKRVMEASGIERITYLEELATAGAGGGTRAVLYANDPEVVEGEIAHFFRFGEPVRALRQVQVPGEEAIGGCHIYFPPGLLYVDGV